MDNPTEKTTDTHATADALVEDVNRLKNDVAQLTADARAHGRAHVDAVQERYKKAVAAVQQHLASHPLTLLGVGVVLGFTLGRRGRRRYRA